ncbi:alpha beta-hydrolase [Coniophora puteana RWD-64-598 SS2]|uniref:Alpha beta-hydrolase n=1 Tax=Coniophora puteana (strain RWD-64-598) TaxID=741705 RepID=A0A5M3MRF4_CONPW|nr:alpha beta-hydrolase [Coniophora puteana RWD-64-598 SS2]EIW81733.1 alpha beta-hydrolase [Coniophora puteana RWD-64-598 SS2]
MLLLASLVLLLPLASAFNPRAYVKETVTRQTEDRSEIVGGRWVDINLTYVDINPRAETTILMVHGWPGLWSTWGRQIDHLESSYHLIAPDLRGFGSSTAPEDVQGSSNFADLTDDLVAVLEHAETGSAICMGHDWGSALCYEAARRRPDIFTAVIGVTVPYLHSANYWVPTRFLVHVSPQLAYQHFFETCTTEAVKGACDKSATEELDADIRRSLRSVFRSADSPISEKFLTSKSSFLDAYNGIDIPLVSFMTEEEEDYLVEEYTRHGFRNTLLFYTHANRYGGWLMGNEAGNHTIPLPALAIYPTDDPVANWVNAANSLGSPRYLPQLTAKTMVGQHWPHMEHPGDFNAIVDEWLAENGFAPKGAVEVHDEL